MLQSARDSDGARLEGRADCALRTRQMPVPPLENHCDYLRKDTNRNLTKPRLLVASRYGSSQNIAAPGAVSAEVATGFRRDGAWAAKFEGQILNWRGARRDAARHLEAGMKAAASVLGLVLAVAIVWLVIRVQFKQGPAGESPPKQVIDVVGVKTDLLAIGQAERLYLASHGSYADLDQLRQDGELIFSGANRRGYNYTAEVNDGQHFKITALPSDPAAQGWPTLSIDESMEVTQQ